MMGTCPAKQADLPADLEYTPFKASGFRVHPLRNLVLFYKYELVPITIGPSCAFRIRNVEEPNREA